MSDRSALRHLFALRLRTERVELRLPRERDLLDLADLAADGGHCEDVMPFPDACSDRSGLDRPGCLLRGQWQRWSPGTPQDWTLEFAVVLDGRAIGTQGIAARDF